MKVGVENFSVPHYFSAVFSSVAYFLHAADKFIASTEAFYSGRCCNNNQHVSHVGD